MTSDNRKSRRRWNKILRLFEPPNAPEGYYSAYLPLLIILCTFILLHIYEIWFLRDRSLTLGRQNERLAHIVQQATEQTQYIHGLRNDLQTLAPAHPAAALILKEFFPDTPPDTRSFPTTLPE